MTSVVEPHAHTPEKALVYRHSLVVRTTHWINVLCFVVLLMSGLQIFNAHPRLYWGNASEFEKPWVAMSGQRSADGSLHGTLIGGREFTTTGVLGASRNSYGDPEIRGFPTWATIPSYRDLATGRRWHFFFAWIFALNGAAYLIYSTGLGHARRDLLPSWSQLSRIGRTVLDHVRLRFPHGPEARHYNVLQKLSYLVLIFALLPLMVITGLTMSPGIDAVFPWLVDLFGGRQSARSVHFICATLLVLFVIAHLCMVVLSGLFNNLRSMITGYYRITTDRGRS
jgi:thiosulfate reductase cytochrome b subunit